MDHELRILLEGMRDDFKAVGERVEQLGDKIDRVEAGLVERLDRVETEVLEVKADVYVLKTDVAVLKTDVAEIRKDLNDHRTNTELHSVKQRA
jgi:hypothetical protein